MRVQSISSGPNADSDRYNPRWVIVLSVLIEIVIVFGTPAISGALRQRSQPTKSLFPHSSSSIIVNQRYRTAHRVTSLLASQPLNTFAKASTVQGNVSFLPFALTIQSQITFSTAR
jgi:hypothetical protein